MFLLCSDTEPLAFQLGSFLSLASTLLICGRIEHRREGFCRYIVNMELSCHTQLSHLHIWYKQWVFVGAWHALRPIVEKSLELRDTLSDAFEEDP
jgi:hypothetical protein